MKINILGSEWTIKSCTKGEDAALTHLSGYADHTSRTIVIRIYASKRNSLDNAQIYRNKVTRHEIVHAFLFESGLAENSIGTDSWAGNEEMIDWFAFQGPKIYKAWQDAGVV